MSVRLLLGLGLAVAALGVGLWTAWVAAENHRLARELDYRQRACDALEVWNASLTSDVLEAEEELLTQPDDEPAKASAEGSEL
ncbi:MAG: hypothetical protein AAF682_12640 [Planctomycetota bacterium]